MKYSLSDLLYKTVSRYGYVLLAACCSAHNDFFTNETTLIILVSLVRQSGRAMGWVRGRIRDNNSPDRCPEYHRVLLTCLGAEGSGLPPVVRRGEPVCPGREAGRRASAAGPGMAHRRVPLDKRVNRGNPTQEGEQVGVAARLVTFLWPRKEKSLAKPRSGGETPSRTESSCPAWRSHAN